MNTWFTADEHYFHEKVIPYCNRPYKNADEMGKCLIKNHNDIVSKHDIVYHLGDFAFVRKDKIMKISPVINQLNGIHHLILGNHDEGKPFTYVNMGFAAVHTALYVDEFLLMHDPAMAVAVDEKQKILCGHIHQLSKWVNPHILNVGIDIWNYAPVSIDMVRKEFMND